jgi:hypothetical protein
MDYTSYIQYTRISTQSYSTKSKSWSSSSIPLIEQNQSAEDQHHNLNICSASVAVSHYRVAGHTATTGLWSMIRVATPLASSDTLPLAELDEDEPEEPDSPVAAIKQDKRLSSEQQFAITCE